MTVERFEYRALRMPERNAIQPMKDGGNGYQAKVAVELHAMSERRFFSPLAGRFVLVHFRSTDQRQRDQENSAAKQAECRAQR
jgi:hypothetical protein